MLRIPAQAEDQHIEIIGDTGSGKTTIIMQLLRQIQARGHSAIVYDPACEFIQRFYDTSRGDIVLNPLDRRCPYWGPSEELIRRAEARTIAASLFQPTTDRKGEFFIESPQKIFAHLLLSLPTPQQLVDWMSHPDEIDERVKGTELAALIDKKAHQQRSGVLGSLSLVADSFRLLPTAYSARQHRSTKWTWTPSPQERSRNLRRSRSLTRLINLHQQRRGKRPPPRKPGSFQGSVSADPFFLPARPPTLFRGPRKRGRYFLPPDGAGAIVPVHSSAHCLIESMDVVPSSDRISALPPPSRYNRGSMSALATMRLSSLPNTHVGSNR